MIEPATEQVMAELPRAGVEETDAAVERAKRAFPSWRAVAPGERSALLHRLANAIEVRVGRSGDARGPQRGQADLGRPRRDGHGGRDLPLLRRRAGAAHRQDDPGRRRRRHDLPRAARRRRPDHPLELPAHDRLLEGGPRPRRRQHGRPQAGRAHPADLARAREDRARRRDCPRESSTSWPVPVQVCGQRLVEHPDVAKIAFTGSTEVGRRIAEGAAGTIKRVTLELGGKSANVIFADADLAAAASSAPIAVFGNAGQDCCARSRILVERSAMDDFMVGARGRGEVDHGRRSALGVDPDGTPDLRRPAPHRLLLRQRRRACRDPRLGPGRPRLLVPADGAGARSPTTPAPPARRSSGRSPA